MKAPLRAVSAPVAALLVTGCADTVNPARTGLRLGLEDGPLRPPSSVEADVFEFPRSAWDEGVGGTTVLKIMIDTDGTVDSALVLESSGHAALDSAALANSRRLLYRPAEQGGEPVKIWGRLPVIYPDPGETMAGKQAKP